MNLERFTTRRGFVKEAFLAGAALATLPRVSHGQESIPLHENSNTSPEAESTFITPDEIVPMTHDSAEYQSITDTQEFVSNKFPYKAEVPIDWINQPGLSTDVDPVDIFLGQIPKEQQTMVWIHNKPVPKGTTTEEYMNDIISRMSQLQEQQFETSHTNPGSFDPIRGMLFKDMENPENYRVGFPNGEEDCWSVWGNIPLEGESYWLSNIGFIKDDVAWQFNFKVGIAHASAQYDEEYKYITMLNSVKLT